MQNFDTDKTSQPVEAYGGPLLAIACTRHLRISASQNKKSLPPTMMDLRVAFKNIYPPCFPYGTNMKRLCITGEFDFGNVRDLTFYNDIKLSKSKDLQGGRNIK